MELTVAKLRAIAEGESRLKQQLGLIVAALMLRSGISEVSFTKREMEDTLGFRLEWEKNAETGEVTARMKPKGGMPV